MDNNLLEIVIHTNILTMKKLKLFLLAFFCCASALIVNGQTDTEFWFVVPEANQFHGDRPIYLQLSSLQEAASVTISLPAQPSVTPITVNILPNSSQSVDLTPWIDLLENTPPDSVMNKGLNIHSTNPVSAYYEIVTSCNCNPEIFALKGKNALGTLFYTPFQTVYYRNPGYYSAADIIATENNTVITLIPTKNAVGHPANVPFSVTLNKGQTYSLAAAGFNGSDNMAGSKITSTKPIAVTVKEDTDSGPGGCGDIIGDQIVPVDLVGTKYIVIRGFLNYGEYVWFLATEDNTSVFVNGSTTAETTLNTGQQYGYLLTGNISVESDKPIYVYHVSGYGCELGSALLPSIECTGSSQIGFTRSTSEPFSLNLIVKNGSQDKFTLNGNPNVILASQFQPVPGAGNQWVCAQVSFNTTQVPVDQGQIIANSGDVFHMGLINGGSVSGCRYGYFSDFSRLYLGQDRQLCQGDTAILDSGFDKDWYLWSTGDTTRTINVSTSGVFWVEAGTGTCLMSDTIRVTVHPLPVDIAQPGGNVSLQTGLVVYFPFNGNADDASGNLNNGVPNGGVMLTSDRFGNANSAYYFDGSNDWISIVPTLPDLFPYGNSVRSVSAWLKYQDHSYNTILYWGDDLIGQNGAAFSFYISDNGLIMDGNYDNGNLAYSFTPDTWYNIVCTYDGAQTIACYSNGQFIGNMTIPFPLQTSAVGHRSVGIKFDVNNLSQNPFKGVIDEVRIYSRILAAEEISALYNGSLYITVPEDTVCQGQPASLQIHNSQLYIKYQVLVNNIPSADIQYGTGSSIGFTINGLAEPSALTISATDTATGCSITLDSTFVIHVEAFAPTVSPDTAIVTGSHVTLTASGGTNYLWSNGMTSPSINVSPLTTTTYYVTITNANGCAASDSMLVTVLSVPASPVTVTYNIAADPNTQVAVPVEAKTFTNITSLSLRLDYNPAHAVYQSFGNVNSSLTGVQVADITVSANLHKIMITWTGAGPVSLQENSRLLDLVFSYHSDTTYLTWNNTDNSGQDCMYKDAGHNPLPDNPTWYCYHNGGLFPARTISGTFNYNNTAATVLDSIHVFLFRDDAKDDSTWTNSQGQYGFHGKIDGTYLMSASTGKPWQGVNGTDAAKIQRHFVGLEPLTEPVRLQAADVNNNLAINATDAVLVKMRFVGQISSFARGNWIFAKPLTGGDSIFVNGTNTNQDFYGLCVGDVNASNSFTIGGKSPSVQQVSNDFPILVTPGQEFDWPVYAGEDFTLSAISLVLDYPPELVSVNGAAMNEGLPVYRITPGQVRIAWSEATPVAVKTGDPILVLSAKTSGSAPSGAMFGLTVEMESELADENAEKLVNPLLEIPFVECLPGGGDPGSNLRPTFNNDPPESRKGQDHNFLLFTRKDKYFQCLDPE